MDILCKWVFKMNEKKVVRRSFAFGLSIICIVVVAGLVGALAYYHYTPTINDKDTVISSLNAENSQLNSIILSLQEQVGTENLTINYLKTILNGTVTPLGIITSNPSVWVNTTVLVQGNLTELPSTAYASWQIPPPWNYLLTSSDGIDQIGVQSGVRALSTVPLNSSQSQIFGIVRQGVAHALNGTDITVFYIEALIVDGSPFAY
jgi:hypothetical protein